MGEVRSLFVVGSSVATLVLPAVHVLTPVSGLRRTPPRWRRPDTPCLFAGPSAQKRNRPSLAAFPRQLVRSSLFAALRIPSVVEPCVLRGRSERPSVAWLLTKAASNGRPSTGGR